MHQDRSRVGRDIDAFLKYVVQAVAQLVKKGSLYFTTQSLYMLYRM